MNTNYQAFAVMSKDKGEYQAMVRKHDFESSLFQWHMFEHNFHTPIPEKTALEGQVPVLIMYRIKPDFNTVPLMPTRELPPLQTTPIFELKPTDLISDDSVSQTSRVSKVSKVSKATT